MLASITGTLLRIDGGTATLRPSGPLGEAATLEVLLPAYLATRMQTRVGSVVEFATFYYLEGQGQGTSFEPRLLGFATQDERRFFDLFTTVKGIGNRKALRAMAEPPAVIASAVVRGDAKALTALPEIGKKLAETIIVELKEKAALYASAESLAGNGPAPRRTPRPTTPTDSGFSGPAADAVEALVRLGEQRPEAERRVLKAVDKHGEQVSVERLVALVFAGS